MVLLIFRNIGWSITDENSFHFLLSKHLFLIHCSDTKISSKFLSLLISFEILQLEITAETKYNV